MSFYILKTSDGQGRSASIYGFDKNNMDVAATRLYSGALIPLLRAARARGELTRLQYKRAKDAIEKWMMDQMSYDAAQSWPYARPTKRDVRRAISRLA